ncbi:hypothetical protein GIB67_018235 [Kingdonia uniflora]|uniref:Alpha-N-acetylglucosaminidase tim-barrel domain-containing protein n=1 Tax=Kingdonia uniflora TaxID=39325 RepID=A0A7J7NMI5_9MAGN|nr:hypothetical protein GIB67_018235 [Kingdonia uniflora]
MAFRSGNLPCAFLDEWHEASFTTKQMWFPATWGEANFSSDQLAGRGTKLHDEVFEINLHCEILLIVPVLPSFSGNVPAALKNIYPSANITRLGEWNTVNADPRWCCTYLLDPSDRLFVEIGEAFIRQQIKDANSETAYAIDATWNRFAYPS